MGGIARRSPGFALRRRATGTPPWRWYGAYLCEYVAFANYVILFLSGRAERIAAGQRGQRGQ